MSSIRSPAAAASRVRLPGKVIANTSKARMSTAPSKPAPNTEAAVASVAIATSGSSAACSSGPAPGWLRNSLVRVSRLAYKAKSG